MEMFLEFTIKLPFWDPVAGNFVAGRKIHLSLFHLSVSAESSHWVDLVTSIPLGTKQIFITYLLCSAMVLCTSCLNEI